MLPAPPALPPPASPTTPGELPEGVFYSFARDSGPQPGHSLLLDADLSCTSRSSVTESALDSVPKHQGEAKVAVSPSVCEVLCLLWLE